MSSHPTEERGASAGPEREAMASTAQPYPSREARDGLPRGWTNREANPYASRRKSPAIAGVLSMLPGLGQVYVGHYRRGFTHILVTGATIGVLSSNVPDSMKPLFALFLSFFWFYNIIDAARLASFYNEALLGMGPIDFQKEMLLPSRGGSLAAGAFLILVGFLLFLNTRFGLSLDWLKEWWPLAPIGFGVYLVYQGARERRKRGGD